MDKTSYWAVLLWGLKKMRCFQSPSSSALVHVGIKQGWSPTPPLGNRGVPQIFINKIVFLQFVKMFTGYINLLRTFYKIIMEK